jgi:hypothetical protein
MPIIVTWAKRAVLEINARVKRKTMSDDLFSRDE